MATMVREVAEPRPPTDLHRRDLPIEIIAAGRTLVRIHPAKWPALHFGTSGDNRFDDPQRGYGVCYAALTIEGAFAETLLRQIGATLVARASLDLRSITELTVVADLRLVSVHGPGLAALGATAAVTSGAYEVAQLWSRALHRHPAGLDGICYRCNHDNDAFAVALFDRCRDHIRITAANPLSKDRLLLGRLLDRYRVGLS